MLRFINDIYFHFVLLKLKVAKITRFLELGKFLLKSYALALTERSRLSGRDWVLNCIFSGQKKTTSGSSFFDFEKTNLKDKIRDDGEIGF